MHLFFVRRWFFAFIEVYGRNEFDIGIEQVIKMIKKSVIYVARWQSPLHQMLLKHQEVCYTRWNLEHYH